MNALAENIKATVVGKGAVCLWWIGQEGFVIKTSRLTIYIDPYLSDYAERITRGQPNEHVRMVPPPLKPEDVDHADLVLCTHDHADHIDPDGIPVIARCSPQARFVVPRCAEDTMLGFGIAKERIVTLAGDDSVELDGLAIHAIPAKHEQFDRDPRKGYPYLSYVLGLEGLNLFHAGDTIPYEGQVAKVSGCRIDVAMVPINGRDEFRHRLKFEGNFTCQEAVEFAAAVQPRLTVPMHYDTFTLNTADVREFERIAREQQVRYRVMKSGECLRLPEDIE